MTFKNIISEKFAINGLLIILVLFLTFHIFVITGIIPFEIVWGGRLKNEEQMLNFETVSIIANLVMLAVVAAKAGLLKVRVNPGIIKVALWLMFVLFLLNTIGNLLSVNQFEKLVFTPVTLILALFSLRLAV